MLEEKQVCRMKSWFMVLNLIIGIIAFSYMVDATSCQDCGSTPLPASSRANVPMSLDEGKEVSVKEIASGASSGKSLVSKIGEGVFSDFLVIAGFTALGALVGGLAGGEDGETWGAVSGLSGALAYVVSKSIYGSSGAVFGMEIGSFTVTPAVFGIGVGVIVFALTYKETSIKTVEFNCLPYEPPVGGNKCELCNEFEECSEYTCKSLGQACEIVNKGTEQEKCIWANPNDVNSPIIDVRVNDKYTTKPFTSVRPPATGVEINFNEGCIKAFTPLEFEIISDEPSQCKIDYNMTSFEEMSYYVGGDNIFDYNHTEKLALPGPDAINALAPELKNDGVYTLYTICRDANGNENENPYAIRFCVEPGPDLTAPVIEDTNVPSGSPIQFNKSTLDLEIYVNEPAECKWSHEDVSYELMGNDMDCNNNLWEMNSMNTYTCSAVLNGIESRKENDFYFRCKDQPSSEESDRNTNSKSFEYVIKGTQPLNILDIEPNEIIRGSSDVIPVFLKVKTDNGYNNGEATCYYSLTDDEDDYIEFLETGGNEHEQRQDLSEGDYTYYIKCVDLGGNADYGSVFFEVETDSSGPVVVRLYKENEELKIITNEKADCSYSFIDCNFEIEDGINMISYDYVIHKEDWKTKKYYIRCEDKYGNQPNPNKCSIIVRPFEVE